MPLPVLNEGPTDAPSSRADPFADERARIAHNLRGVQRIVGVHAGKGGVGKTFVSCNLAMLLAAEGYSVGLLDADIDCPNVHQFLGIRGELAMDEHGAIQPIVHHGIRIISSGLLQAEEEPLIIRGPIKHRVLADMLALGAWGALDYLIIDFPPGTGDVPLSAMQLLSMHGIVLVTTPQKESIADVRRAAGMARALHTPILGLVENMIGLFGQRGAALAAELGVPLLASIPLSEEIVRANEEGACALLADEQRDTAKALLRALGGVTDQ